MGGGKLKKKHPCLFSIEQSSATEPDCQCECASISNRLLPHTFLMLPCLCMRPCSVYAELTQTRKAECVLLQVSQRRYAWRCVRSLKMESSMHNLSAVCHSRLIHTSLSKATVLGICYSVHVLVLIIALWCDKRRRRSVRPDAPPTPELFDTAAGRRHLFPRVRSHHCHRSQFWLTLI